MMSRSLGEVMGLFPRHPAARSGKPGDLDLDVPRGSVTAVVGPSGAGQLGKATNQVIVAGTLAAVSEGMAFARAAGLPLEAIHAALTGGAANSWALEVLGRKMLDRDFAPAFAIKHQQKDLAIVLKTARACGVPLPAAALVHQLLSALEAKAESSLAPWTPGRMPDWRKE